jgi:hypothetical protein
MRLRPHRPSSLLLVLLCSVLAACGPKDWRQARRAGTSDAYHTFALAHGGQPRGAVAERRAEALGWTEAHAAGTSEAFATFAERHPASDHAGEALAQAEVLGWQEASAEDTLPALTRFVARYPSSVHKIEAAARLEELTWQVAQAEGSMAAFGRYLARYPSGPHAADAVAERDRMTWESTSATNTRHAYRKYLEQFPDGAHAGAANAWIEDSYVDRLQPLVALIETHQGRSAHSTVLARVRGAVEAGLLDDLRDMFALEPTRTYDGTNGMPHPHDMLGKRVGTGILVIEIYEKGGQRFEPSGQGTDISAVLRLYAPNTADAVWVREVAVSTPERVTGQDDSALHLGAVQELGDRVRAFVTDLSVQRPEALR